LNVYEFCLTKPYFPPGVWYFGGDCIFTASIDQRVCVWNMVKNEDKIKVCCVCSKTCVYL